ncbi:MAG: dihydrodipicolinate synthase family protein [Algoriphagus sp.]|jgi:1-pyrroline-4-hydroxy-2-carboxylate deaminase|uniref:dihydrodipicolinate synthase family protein n=1 Tax=Algoriphagus sp. TaxID=1872435 RepID=UPI0027503904|nr:dihydrodipicolinate synthase family protein [Algoriphagus sp.]MDP4747472.1 dihydrodipicolinate synthase family protein [Algoriphagus sp.]MDP4838563.1 dihydrodipicolinate synthase family protein [Algoriphagus sp.]MDP4905320.1 dihydrodipicolinate synthase family protein [Algoriphagus sp.]MDP4957829.1 dihydrodipicolinate synthase family protein [Algoriphagus sp.]
MNWKGVFPAVTTKFHADGSLDMDLFFKNIDFQLAAGVHGIILGGTLGESSVLSQEEKITLTRETVNYVNGRVPVVLNIAEGATQDALFWAKKAEELGASGLMILPPMRYAADAREVVAYFKAVANSTKLPMMIYNNPVDYKTLVTLDMFAELADCHNIQAIKESTRDISNVTRMINRFGDRFQLLCGVDTLALEELLMGAVGWVAGLVCAFPKETVVIYNLVQEGKIEEARKIYRWFLPLLELDIHPKLVQYIKLAEQHCGIGSEHVRAPRLTLIGEERTRVEKIITDGIKNRPIL